MRPQHIRLCFSIAKSHGLSFECPRNVVELSSRIAATRKVCSRGNCQRCCIRQFAGQPQAEMLMCWSCGSRCITENWKLVCETCSHLQPLNRKVDYFKLLGLPQNFALDLSKLDKCFKRLQQKAHPDLFGSRSAKEQALSADVSSDINVAYQVLRDPVSRAQYLLQLHGHDAIGETVGTHASDPILLMRIMEARELLEAHGTQLSEVTALQTEIRIAADEVLAVIDSTLTSADFVQAAASTVALQYYSKLLREIADYLDTHADATSKLAGDSIPEKG